MSNNVYYNEPTSGRLFAADELGGTLYQWSKIDIGRAGVSIPLSGSAAFGIPTDVTRVQGTSAISGTVNTTGNSTRLRGTVSVSGAYLSGYLLGSKLTLSNATRIASGQAVIETVVVADNKLTTGASLNVVFFEADPTNTTFTDRSTLTVASGDLFNIVGTVQILSSDYVNFGSNCVATRNGLGFEVNSADRNLYACLVSADSPSYVAPGSLQVTVSIIMIT